MFRKLFAPRYRIKKIGIPKRNGKVYYKYHLQFSYILFPIWQTGYTGDGEDEEYVREKMKNAIYVAQTGKTVTHIYNPDPPPDHIPESQRERYIRQQNKASRRHTMKK